jgi:hypothetical protein
MNKTGKQMRFTDVELSMIKNTFSDNDELLKVLRKVFLPELDPNAPIGQMVDLWMTMKIEDQSAEQAMINLKARNTVIQHLDMCLMQLGILAGQKEDSVEDTKKKLLKDSAK